MPRGFKYLHSLDLDPGVADAIRTPVDPTYILYTGLLSRSQGILLHHHNEGGQLFTMYPKYGYLN